MTKMNSAILAYSGGIGECTIYQRDRETLMRSRRNLTHRYARTQQQLRQCARMGNIVALWRAFPEGYCPSFEHRRKGVTNYNRFITYAMTAHPVYLTRRQAYLGASVLTDVAVSQGSLLEINVSLDNTAPITDIRLGDLHIDRTTTVRQLAQAVVDNNHDYRYDDSLRYYLAEQLWDGHNDIPVAKIHCQKLVLDLTDHRPLWLAVDDSIGFAERDGRLAARHSVEGGMAWVHVRRGETEMRLSSQRLVCTNTLAERYGSEEAFMEACKDY